MFGTAENCQHPHDFPNKYGAVPSAAPRFNRAETRAIQLSTEEGPERHFRAGLNEALGPDMPL